jgi:asparagine synthase (glutamine-hydrolysing)
MSGLCAAVRWDGAPLEPHTLEPMTRAAPHRGRPTHHTTASAHLAHQTHHPLTPPQPTTLEHATITASARIDNRDELLPGLTAHLPGPSPTDAQLILAAHHRWGDDAPRHLIGDYAYTLFDRRTRTLFAARDPMGMRPLYYHHTDRRTLIASEVKQLLALPGVEATLFEPMVAAFLAGPFGRDDWTFFQGILRLPPGHALLANAGGLRVWRTWEPDPGREERYPREEDYAARLRELFLRAVHDRLRESGPHGLLLSGGVDSGSIAAAAGWLAEQGRVERVRTYSWAFEELAAGDERRTSRRITERYGLPAVAVPADDAWPLAGYPEHGPDADDPFVNVYQLLMNRSLAMAAADGCRSVLSGDRGDPLIGDWIFDHLGPARAGRLGLVARELRAHAAWLGRPLSSTVRAHLLRPALEELGLLKPATRDPRRFVAPYVAADWARRVGLTDIIAADYPRPTVRGHARAARWARAQRFRGLLDPVPQERHRARFGLSFADPWADQRVVEFVLATPPHMVQRPSESKRLARLAVASLLPPGVAAELGKTEPVDLFARGWYDRGRQTVIDLFTDMRLAELGFVDEAALRAAYEADLAGHPPRHDLWWAVSLEMWLRLRHG